MHTQGNAHTRWCTHKAVCGHRRSLVVQGGCGGWSPHLAKRAEAKDGWAVLTQGGAHRRWCKHKALHTQGGVHTKQMHAQGGWWPPQEPCHSKEVRGLAPALSEVRRSKGGFGGPHTRRCTQKAVHTQGGAHTRRCTRKAVCGYRRSLVAEGGCGGWPTR